jgi:hypothetical protein
LIFQFWILFEFFPFFSLKSFWFFKSFLFFEFFKNLKIFSNFQAGGSFLWVMRTFGHVKLGSINETSKRYARGDSNQFGASQLGNVRGRNNTWWIWLGILASFQTRIPWPLKQRNSGL